MTSTFRRAASWLAALVLACLFVPSAHAGDRYALLVGVKNYNKTELRNLTYSENDVAELAQLLRDAGYKRVVLMTQSAALAEGDNDLLPTSDNIRAQLKAILDDRQADDTVLVAFSGHGVQLKGKKEHYFCPMDAKLASTGTLISLPEVYDRLGACKAGAKVMLVDACRNDPQSGLDKGGDRPQVELPSDTRPQAAPAPGGVAVVFSCSEGEKSFEDPKLNHGLFFNFVIEGLKGKAANDKGEVGLDGLAQYVKDHVKDQVKSDIGPDKSQVPQSVNNINGSLTLLTIKITINPPPDGGGERGAVRAAIKKGREHLEHNEWGLARSSFSVAIELDPKSAEAYAYRAKANDNAHKLDDALEDGDKAVDLDSNSALAYAFRCEVYADKGDLDKAIADGDRAVDLDPKSAVARRSRGYAYGLKGDKDAALRDYDEAIRLDPAYADPYVDRGYARLADGQDDDALKDFNQAVALAPKSSNGYLGRSSVRIKQEMWDLALDDLNAAVQMAPKDADALSARGDFHRGRGDVDKAVADYRAAIRLAPKLADPHVSLAGIYADKGDADRAIEEYSEAIELDPKNVVAFDGRGWQRYNKADYDAAAADFGKAIEIDATYADAFKGRGYANHKLGKTDAALDDLNEAIRLNATDDGPFNERGVIRYEQGDYAKAIEDFDEAIKLNEKDPQLYMNRADAYEKNGDNDKAEADRKKAEELKGDGKDPGSPPVGR